MKSIKITAFLAVLIILGALAGAALKVNAQAVNMDSIRLSFESDPATSMTITWRTANRNAPVLAQYGKSPSLGMEASGQTVPSVVPNYWYHTVALTNLEPNTIYYYRVPDAFGVWTELATFRTAPRDASDFRFTVFANNGTVETAGQTALTLKDAIAAARPDLHLVTGSFSGAESTPCATGANCSREHWDAWFREMSRIGATAPIMPAPSASEFHTSMRFDWGEWFYTRSFAVPPTYGEGYYSFDYGDVHFAMVTTAFLESLVPGSYQYGWLDYDLAHTNKTWKVVVMSDPVYSSAPGGPNPDFKTWFGPLFDRHNVDLVISGRDHMYERSYPLLTRITNEPALTTAEKFNYTNPDGTVYVTTGGGGQELENLAGVEPAWAVTRCGCYEFLQVDVVGGTTLVVRALKADGSLVDQFNITKGAAAPAPAPTPEPVPLHEPATPRAEAAHWPVRGFNLPVWSRDGYSANQTHASLVAMKATGATAVAVSPVWLQETWNASEVRADAVKSPSADALRSIIRKAKSEGLRVVLKPFVVSRDESWSGFFAPKDPVRWLETYRALMLETANLAAAEQVDMLILGTELPNLASEAYSAVWRALIADVRNRYHGELSYDANWLEEFERIEFWDALDVIAVSANFPVATTLDASIEAMIAGWHGGAGGPWFQKLEVAHERFGKPVLFAEIGYQARNGAALRPWGTAGALDVEEQARAYQAAFEVWKNVPWFHGMLFWRWPTDPSETGAADSSTSIRGKLTEAVVKRFWQQQ